jgi:acyl-ACP thioesterase
MSENKNVTVENGCAELTLFIEPDTCDMTALWRPSAAVTAMQLATHYVREALGIDWGTLAQKGALWVVSRINLSFARMPRMGEKIILRATAMPALKALYPWQFSFIDSDGNKIGEGSTLWNLMNAETRRIMVIPEIDAKIPRNAAGGARSLPSPAKELETSARRQTLSPVYTDLDINGHASHLRYIDWCCNRLGHELMSKYWIKDFRISYMQEVRADQTVSTELRVDGQDFSFAGYDGATCCFVIDGTLASRT